MIDRFIEYWMLLFDIYYLVTPDPETQAEKYARISYKICVGEDETFNKIFGKLAK